MFSMVLNAQLEEKEAIEQLNLAREEITKLQIFIEEINKEFKLYKNFEKNREREIPANVDFLYYQLAFLRQCGEQFVNIVTRDDKIVRIEAMVPPD